jgi:Ca2+-binding RTX toxin-like protein
MGGAADFEEFLGDRGDDVVDSGSGSDDITGGGGRDELRAGGVPSL